MNNHPSISRKDLQSSLIKLGESLYSEKIPEKVLHEALQENPWFTPYYIKSSLEGIRIWLQKESLENFLANYPIYESPPKEVAVIAAGNLPLVCFHDVLMSLLAGHICLLKTSHRDRVLISYVRKLWIEIFPEIAAYFQLVEKVEHCDFLISTGSNNTARYIEAKYPHTPKLIRKNRFSVGLLTAEMNEEEMKGLAKDIFLYNGLGCRNVSNLLIFPEADLPTFYEILNDYPQNLLNPFYLERVLYERSRLEQLGGNFKAFPKILVDYSPHLSFASMGLMFGVHIQQEGDDKELLTKHRDDIQIIVGQDTAYGYAQNPALNDFADDVDTLKLLSTLSNPPV